LDFVAVTSDSQVVSLIASQLAKPAGSRDLFVTGRIERGNAGHNLAWSWHFIPDQWSLASVSIELCDGSPSMVEQNIDYWVGSVGRFCPWDSYVKSEVRYPL
jgi:hypothetical protein